MSVATAATALRLTASACGLLMACAGLPAQAQATSPEALDWLRMIYQATQKLSYTGTFVYQQGTRSETSRLTRRVTRGGGVERLEALDGQPREVVRTRDGVRCYLPKLRMVKVDRHEKGQRFPALLPEQFGQLAEHYVVTLGEITRVAGYDCQQIVLTPRDTLRYGYSLCADTSSGMLLKSVTFDERRMPVEQFTFTQLSVGRVTRDMVKPPHTTRDWSIEDAQVKPADLARSGWHVEADLPGFRKIVEVTRMLRKSRPVNQVVYSDGLAAVSVFIESVRGGGEARMGLASVGGINIYTRRIADHVVTVVGDAPPASVQRIAEQVRYEPK